MADSDALPAPDVVDVNPEDIVRSLIANELLDARDAVRGGLSIVELPQRNQNFVVRCSTRPGYFVKVPRSPQDRSALANEAEFYRNTRPGGWFEKLQPFVPRFFLHDAATSAVVLELFSRLWTGTDLAQLALHAGGPIATSLARILATCHALGRDDDAPVNSAFARMLPWAFNMVYPTPQMFRDLTPLQLHIVRLVQQQSDLAARFDHIRRGYSWESLTHGDLRWVNVLGLPGEGSADLTSLRLIDWEGVGTGDPAWDVASVFSAYLGHCLLSLPLQSAETPAAAAEMFARALPDVRAPMHAFWTSYAAAAGLSGTRASELRRRALVLTALRLLQFAFEWAQVRAQMPRFVLCSLQLAVNIATDSDEGRAALLHTS